VFLALIRTNKTRIESASREEPLYVFDITSKNYCISYPTIESYSF